MPRFRSTAAGLRADFRRGAAVWSGALAGIALVELIATFVAYAGPVHVGALWRLVFLDLTLASCVWVVGLPVVAALTLAPRAIVRGVRGPEAARAYPGPGASALPGVWVARALAVLVVAAIFVWWSSRTMTASFPHKDAKAGWIAPYQDTRLVGLLLAVVSLIVLAALAALGVALGFVFELARRGLERVLPAPLQRANPFGRAPAALIVVTAATITALLVEVHWYPYMQPLVPWRWMIDLAAAVIAGGVVLAVLRRRGHLLPRARRTRRVVALATAGAALVVIPITLTRLGADPDTKGIALSASPGLEKLIAGVRWANDFDGDGFGSLLGETDCAPFDPAINPLARDVPDDGIDQNCNGKDSTMRDLVAPSGERMPVPVAYQKPWNILLITIDATRYDHTSFGGYKEASGRDTTPNLAALADRSVSFDFANSSSAGTVAVMPSIMTSKFFHSGIALDENRKAGMPPKIKPENVLIGEVLKRAGFVTGAITSHAYFENWGMDQGIDEYDNSIGRDNPSADAVTSDQSTHRALAWITRHANQKWFLWVHYFDPHGHYVAHPDGPQYQGADSEMDLYDGELHYTDQWLGELFDELARLPGADHTIVVITADHGDAFEEHGTRNHGDTLYHELLRVPLVFAIPDLPPRKIGGAVSNLDILPTLADLAGIDTSDLSFEGRSLVPQIFYGKEDDNRVVFAETNYQNILRAAVNARYKLIYDLKNNHYKLFDIVADPGEKNDLAQKDPQALAKMKDAMDAWLARVMFARNADDNQVMTKVQGILLDKEPTPANPVVGTSVDEGRIQIIGWDLDPASPALAPGVKVKIGVYFAVKEPPKASYKLQLSLWNATAATFDPKGAIGPKVARSSLRITAEGFLPTDQWHPGDFIRDRFEVTIPADWTGDAVGLGIMFQGDAGKLPAAGQVASTDPTIAVLGMAPMVQKTKAVQQLPGLEAPTTPLIHATGGGSGPPSP